MNNIGYNIVHDIQQSCTILVTILYIASRKWRRGLRDFALLAAAPGRSDHSLACVASEHYSRSYPPVRCVQRQCIAHTIRGCYLFFRNAGAADQRPAAARAEASAAACRSAAMASA